MPFGLSPATYVFYLYFKPFVTRWRSLGMTASIWIDDGIIAAPTKEQCKYFRDIVRNDLRESGWRWNSKSDWELKQTGEYLGFIIDTIRFVFSIPEKKIKKLKDFILKD